jgi:hypothetical protein
MNTIQQADKAPEVDLDDANYAHCQVTETFQIHPDQFLKWLLNEPLENFMLGTMVVSPIVGTELLSEEAYGAAGTSRLIHFKDKTIAKERVLSENFPESYSYQAYGYNNPIRFLADYAKAAMRVEADGENTRLIWDYAFHSKNKAALSVVKLFVSLDWKRNMTNALAIVKAHLEEHGPSVHIHEVSDLKKAA